jgi:hypothetical protein
MKLMALNVTANTTTDCLPSNAISEENLERHSNDTLEQLLLLLLMGILEKEMEIDN